MKAIGPAYIYLITDFTTGAGVKISDMESVSFDPGFAMLGSTNAFTGDAILADSIYQLPPNATVSAELYDISIDAIANLVFGAVVKNEGDGEGAIGFGKPGITKIDEANVPTLFVLPASEEASGINAPHGIWLPKVATESLASIVFNRPTEGGNANSYTVAFRGAQTSKIAGVDLPSGFEFGWYGDPAEVGLDTSSWLLEPAP